MSGFAQIEIRIERRGWKYVVVLQKPDGSTLVSPELLTEAEANAKATALLNELLAQMPNAELFGANR